MSVELLRCVVIVAIVIVIAVKIVHDELTLIIILLDSPFHAFHDENFLIDDDLFHYGVMIVNDHYCGVHNLLDRDLLELNEIIK